MIFAFMGLFMHSIFGGSAGTSGLMSPESLKELRQQTAVVVTDAARAETAEQVLKDLGVEVKAFEKEFAKAGKQLTEAYRDHSTRREVSSSIVAELNMNWDTAQKRALDLRFKLRDSLTEEEWATLFKVNPQ